MRPIQLVILLVAVGAAAGAGLIATRIGTRAPDTPQEVAVQPAAPPIDLEDVLVASKDIGIGKTVDAENLVWKPWPKDGLSDGYIQRSGEPDAVTDLKGMLARSPILAGEPLRMAKLVRSDRGFLSAVLSEFVDELFPGMEVKGAYQFRVTRNSELLVDEQEVENLALALRDELAGRGYLRAMRLEIAGNCPKPIVATLLNELPVP